MKKQKKRAVGKKDFFLRNYSLCWKFLKESKRFFYFSVICFFVLAVFGFIFPLFFKEKIFELIKELLLKFEGLNVYETILFIFLNNLKASFFAIIFGIGIGIVPLITLIANSYLLGFVARYTVAQEGILVLWKLFPHGIFELPAILISISIGLKIGYGVLKKEKWKKIREDYIGAVRFFIFVIIPLLLIAAIIEGILFFYLN